MESKNPIVYTDLQPRELPARVPPTVSTLAYVLSQATHDVQAGTVYARYDMRDPDDNLVGFREHWIYDPEKHTLETSELRQANVTRWMTFWGAMTGTTLDAAWTNAHHAAARDAGIIPPEEEAEAVDIREIQTPGQSQ